MKTRLLILIVLYEKKLSTSLSLQSISKSLLMNIDNIKHKIVVWDNSEKPNNDLPNNDNLEYIFSGNNEKLSVVYNKVSTKYATEFSHLILLDDDTNIPTNYISTLLDALKNESNIDLFIPKVMNKGIMVSPGRIKLVKGSLIETVSPGVQATKGITLITSGICISSRYILEKSCNVFDERLSLYSVDTKFMKDFRNQQSSYFLIDSELSHDTALRNEKSVKALAYRYNNLLRSWLIVYSDNFLEKISIRVYVLYHILKFTLNHRSFKLLSLMFGLNNGK